MFRRSLAILPSLGRLVVYGAASKEVQPIDTLKLLFRSQGVFGLHLNAIFERPSLMGESIGDCLNGSGRRNWRCRWATFCRLHRYAKRMS